MTILRYVLVIGAFLFLAGTGVTAWLCMNELKKPESQEKAPSQMPEKSKKLRAFQVTAVGFLLFGTAYGVLHAIGVI